MSSNVPLFVLYGSATGNAEHIAKSLAQTAQESSDWSRVVCCEADQFKKQCQATWEGSTSSALLIVASTTGNGDAPENAGRFVRFLKRKTTPVDSFQNVTYAVLALGDTNYDQFCECGQLMDKQLHKLGGKRLQKVACADEGTGLEAVVDPWTETILTTLAKSFQTAGDDATKEEENPAEEEKEEAAAALDEEKKVGSLVDIVKQVSLSTTETSATATTSATSEATASDASTTTTTSLSLGVQQLRSLLQLKSVDPLPAVEASLLPTLTKTRLSSCTLVDPSSSQTNGATPATTLDETQSVSTTSSGFYYTAQRPFSSTILQARYLTQQTSTDAAAQVASTVSDKEWRVAAQKTFDQTFDLLATDPNQADRHGKRVIEMTLSLPDDYTLEYQPGDSLGLLVDNTPQAVQFVLQMLQQHHGITGEQQVVIGQDQQEAMFEGTVQEALTSHIDLSSTNSIQPRLLRTLAQFTNDPHDRLALEFLATSKKGSPAQPLYQTMIQDTRWNLVDVLQAFPSVQPQMTLETLFALLPQIPPRYYSVSSSPTLGNELTVTFAVVDYLTQPGPHGISARRVHGLATQYLEHVCSPFLSSSSSSPVQKEGLPALRIFPKPTADFRLPPTIQNKQPLIFVGPGTGVAPFVGFLRHLQALQQQTQAQAQTMVEGTWRGDYQVSQQEDQLSKENAGAAASPTSVIPPVYVFFGCRHQDHDYLYRDELAQFVAQGLITKLYTAFSRDGGGGPKYVQDAMVEPSTQEILCDLLVNQQARLYLCGDGNEMAKDVQKALAEQVLSEKGGHDYLEKMKENKRFLLDIWS